MNIASLRRWLCSYPYTPEAILIIRDLLRGKLRLRSQLFKRGKSLRPLGAWSENYRLAIKSAQAASIRKTPRYLAGPQILGRLQPRRAAHLPPLQSLAFHKSGRLLHEIPIEFFCPTSGRDLNVNGRKEYPGLLRVPEDRRHR